MNSLKHWAQTAACATLVAGVLTLNPAMAHGSAKARHGGIVQMASDLEFELVTAADGAILYVVDHDQPLASKGVTGKLTVLQGSNKSEALLKEDGDNKLRAQGFKLAKGDKVVAVLNNLKGKTTTVRFTVR